MMEMIAYFVIFAIVIGFFVLKSKYNAWLSGSNDEVNEVNRKIKLAQKGDVTAQDWVGRYFMYQNGRAAKVRGEEWLTKAAENGYIDSMRTLSANYSGIGSSRFEKNPQKELYWRMKAAEKGDAASKFRIAKEYEFGGKIEKNKAKAVNIYKELSENGYPEAQLELAKAYETIMPILPGITHDVNMARKWYAEAIRNFERQIKIMPDYREDYEYLIMEARRGLKNCQ